MTAMYHAALHRAPLRHTALSVLLSAALLLLLLPDLVNAVVYTTPISSGNVPAVYGSSGSNPVEGLYQTCLRSANTSATQENRMALTVRTESMAFFMADAVGTGTYYIGGYYDAALNGWYWNDGLAGIAVLFGQGPTCTAVNGALALKWAAGYPKLSTDTQTVGNLRFMVYSSALEGWMNVAGTETYDGVACESQDNPFKESKKFPWWAILIIVIGCLVVVAVVVLIIVCCCCCKKEDNKSYAGSEEREEPETERKSFRNSRSASFNSYGTRYRTASRARGSFVKNGSSCNGASYSNLVSVPERSTSAWSSSSDMYSSYSGSSDDYSSESAYSR